MISRRHLLRSAAAAAPVLIVPPLFVAASAASASSSLARVHRSYAEFANAMDELTAGMSNGGWLLAGAGRRRAFGHLPASAWALPKLVHYEAEDDSRCSHGCFVTDWFREIDGVYDLERPDYSPNS